MTTHRLYLHPEPANGPHPGYRGPLRFCEYGIWLSADCEWLVFLDNNDPFNCDWEPVEVPTLIPWARIHSVEASS